MTSDLNQDEIQRRLKQFMEENAISTEDLK